MNSLWHLAAELGTVRFSWTWSLTKKEVLLLLFVIRIWSLLYRLFFFSFTESRAQFGFVFHSIQPSWSDYHTDPDQEWKKQRQHSAAVWVGVLPATGHAPLHCFASRFSKTVRWVRGASWMVTISLRNDWLSGQQNALQCTRCKWNPPSERVTCIWVMP